jgi:hypothetical protein
MGRWRERDPAGPVDTSAQLPGGQQIRGIEDLKSHLITERRDDFLRALTEQLLSYALGREMEYFDEHALREIVAKSKADGYRARGVIKGIVNSYPFLHREVMVAEPENN